MTRRFASGGATASDAGSQTSCPTTGLDDAVRAASRRPSLNAGPPYCCPLSAIASTFSDLARLGRPLTWVDNMADVLYNERNKRHDNGVCEMPVNQVELAGGLPAFGYTNTSSLTGGAAVNSSSVGLTTGGAASPGTSPDPTKDGATAGTDGLGGLPLIGEVQSSGQVAPGAWIGFAAPGGSDEMSMLGLLHPFVQTYTSDGGVQTFEAGLNGNGQLAPMQYGSTLSASDVAVELTPPPGIDAATWANEVDAVYSALAGDMANSGIDYHVGSNSANYVAYGLQYLGYTPDQIDQIMSNSGFAYLAGTYSAGTDAYGFPVTASQQLPDFFAESSPLSGYPRPTGPPGFNVYHYSDFH